ncbi:hypothetical protein D5R95_02010 [Methanosalsum natronophilum]|uniref:Integrase SSV1 C-terminal domain-containing protein n=1 Tax=Methanosalsum natronophilum TaxID=768733 RepID=A0A424Z3L7_9EURY|nr:MAG: hypothetical protein D5R95_02010 [Methanosalsum natronophilum]
MELGEKRFGFIDRAPENFSEPRGDSDHPSDNIGISLQDIYQEYRDPLILWLKKNVKDSTADQYISAVDRLMGDEDLIRHPRDLEGLISGKADRGLRALFNYVEKEMDHDHILGEPLSKWRRYTPIKASGVVEIYPTDEEITEAYGMIAPAYRPLFLILMYTGNRLTQILDTIQSIDQSEITYAGPNKEIAHISAAAQARGTKRSYRLFFPAAFIPDLMKFQENPASREEYASLLQKVSSGRVSAKTIRKWHLNFMIENGVSESIADFIQGRTPATVGSAHYLNKVKGATEALIPLITRYPVDPKAPIKKISKPAPAPVQPPGNTPQKGSLQEIWIKHADGFKQWSIKTGKGKITTPEGKPRSQAADQISGYLKNTQIRQPSDIHAPIPKAKITALRLFIRNYLPGKEDTPAGYTIDQWLKEINYTKQKPPGSARKKAPAPAKKTTPRRAKA